jgi:hypothetical protein
MGRVLERAKAIERSQDKVADVNDLAKSISADRVKLLEAAEQIIRSREPTIMATNSTWAPRIFFTTEELHVFDALSWDNDRLRNEIGRICNLVRWEREAATTAERHAAEARRDEAEQNLAVRGSEIQSKVASLQRELRSLETTHRDAAALVEKQRLAVEQLQKLAPPDRVEAHERQFAAIAPLRARIVETESRLSTIKMIIELPVSGIGLNEGNTLQQIARDWGHPEIVTDQRYGGFYVNATGWQRFVNELKAEIPTLETKLAELRTEYDNQAADADAKLFIYVL